MPKFYFHLYNDMDVPDDEGKDLLDLHSARAWASWQARVLVGETVKEEGRVPLKHRIDIEDERHEVVGSISFGDVVTIES
jgi:hypothetical protein